MSKLWKAARFYDMNGCFGTIDAESDQKNDPLTDVTDITAEKGPGESGGRKL